MRNAALIAAFMLPLVLFSQAYTAEAPAEQKSVQFMYYYPLMSADYGYCYSYCQNSCMSSCASAAAGAGIGAGGCGSACGACAGYCQSAVASATEAGIGMTSDGLPIGDTSQMPSLDMSHLVPIGGAGVTSGGEIPHTPASTGETIEGAGITVGDESCPAFAKDGHPMMYSQILGCYDSRWKDDYCAAGGSCQGCANLQGCYWTGAACIACNAASCNFACGDGIQRGARRDEVPANPPATAIVKPTKVTPAPAATTGAVTPTAATGGAGPTVAPTGTAASITPAPTGAPTATATASPSPSARNCRAYASCSDCAGKSLASGQSCGWSEFFGACIGLMEFAQVSQFQLKAGWISEVRSCPAETGEQVSCSEYGNCLACAGKGGVKRKCQWAVDAGKCVAYDAKSSFKNPANPDGKAVISPDSCSNPDCGRYTACSSCAENAACVWSIDDAKCVNYGSGARGDVAYDADWCKPLESSYFAKTKKLESFCPVGCSCSENNTQVTECGGTSREEDKLVSPKRALLNSLGAAGLDAIGKMEFKETEKGPTYRMEGTKFRMLLFFIPTNVDVTATVDAKTGEVTGVEQPWWAFLAG